jgi:uncharacterized coiled-coil DUF342 family protein
MNWEDKSNNEILMEIQQIKADHEAIKLTLIKGVEEMDRIEKLFNEANTVLTKRLKGE